MNYQLDLNFVLEVTMDDVINIAIKKYADKTLFTKNLYHIPSIYF